jgi:transposase
MDVAFQTERAHATLTIRRILILLVARQTWDNRNRPQKGRVSWGRWRRETAGHLGAPRGDSAFEIGPLRLTPTASGDSRRADHEPKHDPRETITPLTKSPNDRRRPIAWRHRPFSGDLAQVEIQQLHRRRILALIDALGNFLRSLLLPGQRFVTVGIPPLIEALAFDARGAKVVIFQHPRRAKPLAIDEEMYQWRHLIENFFGKLKEFKRIALRADRTDQSFAAMIHSP